MRLLCLGYLHCLHHSYHTHITTTINTYIQGYTNTMSKTTAFKLVLLGKSLIIMIKYTAADKKVNQQ